MRDVSDAELTSRVQHLVPWVQDILDQARERQALLDTLRQQREAAPASPASQAAEAPADLQAHTDQAVQQALAAHQAINNGTPLANGQASEAKTPPPCLKAGVTSTRSPWSGAAMPVARGGRIGSRANSATARAKRNGAPVRPHHPAGHDPAPPEEESR